MSRETWSDRVLSLSYSLHPLLTNLKHYDAITFCLNRRSELMDFIKSMTDMKKEKSVQLAREYMRDGTNKFESRSFEECLSLFSKSIFYAPKNSSDLPIAYVKRSLVLLYLGYYSESIHDIEMALVNGFSRQNRLQEAIQLLHMEDYINAVKILYEVLRDLKVLHMGQCGEDEFKMHSRSKRNKLKWNLPRVKNGDNPDFPSSSNCIQVLYDDNKGRYVVAKSDIKAGDVLFVEKAFAFTVRKPYCSDCCQETVAPIPCLNCVDFHFCSEKCRDNAWETYHKFECGFTNLLTETGLGYLVLRIIFKAAPNFEELKNIIHTIITKKKFQGSPVTFSRNKYENVYCLQTHADSMSVEDLLQYSLTATLLALYLVHYTTYATLTDENIKVIGQILLHHITQLSSNAHAISVDNQSQCKMISPLTFEEKKIGGGIYPSVSIMNHSCEPSIINIFYKDTIIVRAYKDIKKGEEIFNSYGVDSKKMERSERQKLLKDIYFFDCNCPSCSQEHDPYDLLNSLKCGECNGPLVPDSNRKRTLNNDKKFVVCVNCGSLQSLEREQSLTVAHISGLIEDGKYKLVERIDLEGALRDFVEAWKMGRTILYKLHADLLLSATLSAHCLFLMGDLKRSIAFMKCSVLSVEGRFGSLSSELAFEAKKLSDSILAYCDKMLKSKSEDEIDGMQSMRTIGLQYYHISENFFTLFYGEDYPILSEIETSKARLQNIM